MSVNNLPIGIFDSGVGGITTLAECRKKLPQENFIFLGDNCYIPYGNRSIKEIKERVVFCCNALIKMKAKAIVVACNTATNAGIIAARSQFKLPIIGIEPALKVATDEISYGKIIVLCTESSSRAHKFSQLINHYGNKNVIVLPQRKLANLVEKNANCIDNVYEYLCGILIAHTDAVGVVLGCTHYVLLKELIKKFYSMHKKDIKIFDGNSGVANRLYDVLKKENLLREGISFQSMPSIKMLSTKNIGRF